MIPLTIGNDEGSKHMARGIAHREWFIHRDDYETDQDFRAAVENEQALNVHIQERLGVAIVAAPVRQRDEFGNWRTAAYIFQTASVPAAREAEQADEGGEDYQPEPLVEDSALVEDPAR